MTQLIDACTALRQTVFVGLVTLLLGCGGPATEPEAPALAAVEPTPLAGPVSPELGSAAPSHLTGPIGPDTALGPDWSTEPMAGWTLEPTLEAFHATWTAFAAQSASGTPSEDGLVPYADAVAHLGASWGLATDTPVLLLFDPSGQAYRYPEGRHGPAPLKEPRHAIELEALTALGLAELQAGAAQHLSYDGHTLRMSAALRAEGACAACHDQDQGALLGAYLYTFTEIADD